MIESQTLYIFSAVLAVCNAVVSVVLVQIEGLNRGQKLAQLAIVWLLPVLGAVIVAVVNLAQRGQRRQSTNSDNWQNAESPGQWRDAADD